MSCTFFNKHGTTQCGGVSALLGIVSGVRIGTTSIHAHRTCCQKKGQGKDYTRVVKGDKRDQQFIVLRRLAFRTTLVSRSDLH